ncbi:rho guanyl nucleotide exchange [Ophiostoma piceae UAMH 11346]|uniref:Rho guanyl nucleotide exchange n=1 Tax=Ophiostoma piceae (strain UAMH 11346) TaxID=1262450 RepID=S3BTZ9_OPHP1|nr:rho guanyl nucleotide exchange [Ophiostoma piceae UAMH 11346]
MDGGHRDEDDPLDPPNRLDRLDRLDLDHLDHLTLLSQRAGHLDHIDTAATTSDHSRSLFAHAPSDRFDANLDQHSHSIFDLDSHVPPASHFFGHHHHHHHQTNTAAVLSHNDLQSSLLSPFDVVQSPTTLSQPPFASLAGVGFSSAVPSAPHPASNSSSLPFPAFPTGEETAHDDPGDFYRSFGTAPVAFSAADLMAPAPPVSARPPPISSHTSPTPNGVTAKQLQDQQHQQHQHQQPAHHPQLAQQHARPPVSLANRGNGTIRSIRSVSSPAGNNNNGTANSSTPARHGYAPSGSSSTNVKEMKKRFDQFNTTPGSSSIPAPSGSTGGTASSSLRSKSRTRAALPSTTAARSRAGTGNSTSSASGSSLTMPKSSANRSHGLPPSNNPNSFASRIGKPRTAAPASLSVGQNAQASKSASNISSPLTSPRAARMASPPPPPPVARANGLLFGEISANQSDSITIGYGIDAAVRPRRTSESTLHNPARIFSRSTYDMNNGAAEPSSPTDWYRSVGTSSGAGDIQPLAVQNTTAPASTSTNTAARIPAGHSRAHSDLAGTRVPLQYQHYQHQNIPIAIPPPPSHPPPRLDTQAPNPSGRLPNSVADMPQSPTSPTSRLPISVRKLSEASGHSSTSSTRSNSPASSAAGRRPGTSSRVPRHQQHQGPPPSTTNAKTPARRAATPTSTTASSRARASGTTTPSSSRKGPPSSIATPSNNGRLSAYAAPAPKLSPPLRSSRPRQPISSANAAAAASRLGGRTSAASSSSSAAERSRMPYASSTRSSSARHEDSRTNRRKIDVGPIDFAQRRETIRLKYSKSIRETEAVAARQAAAEKRKKELEAAAKAKGLAEAAVRAQSDASRNTLGAPSAAMSTKSSVSSLFAMANAQSPSTHTSDPSSVALKKKTSKLSLAPSHTAIPVPVPPIPSGLDFAGQANQPLPLPSADTSDPGRSTTPVATASPHQVTDAEETIVEPPALKISTSVSDLEPSASKRQPPKIVSPTLGLPGAFPSMPPTAESNPDYEEPPLSAVSATSVITEFDIEPQVDLAQSCSAENPHLPEESWQDEQQLRQRQYSHDRVEYQSAFDLRAFSNQPSQANHSQQHQEEKQVQDEKAVYHYPFEDDAGNEPTPMPNSSTSSKEKNNEISPFDRFIPGSYGQDNYESRPFTPSHDHASSTVGATSLHQSPVLAKAMYHSPLRHAPSATDEDITIQLGVALPDADESATESVEIGFSTLVAEDHRTESTNEAMAMIGHSVEPEYEVTPFRPATEQTTTVTILSRETSVSSRRPSLSRFNSSSSARRSVPDDASYDQGVGYYTTPMLKDNIAMLRGSTFTASDVSDEPQHSGGDQRTPETSNSLLMPSILSPANRSSQQSGWTDFSIESEDARAFFASRDSALVSDANGFATIRARAPSARQNIQSMRRNPYEFDSRPESYIDDEPQSQHGEDGIHGAYGQPRDENGQHDDTTQNVLPEVDTGSNFFIPYLTDDKISGPHIPVIPDHDPPPIPVSVDGRGSSIENSMRPGSSSAYYDSSRPNSFALGTRDDHDGQDSFTFGGAGSIGDSAYPLEPPPALAGQSSKQVSLEIPRQSISGATLIDIERHGGTDGASDATGTAADTGATPPAGSPKKAVPTKEQTRLVQRQMVIRELVDTEAIFVRDMNIVEEIYKGTAEACPQLDANTVKLIFRNTDEIITFHTTFLIQLKEAVSTIYVPRGGRRSSPLTREDSIRSESGTLNSTSAVSVAGTAGTTGTGLTAATVGTAVSATSSLDSDDTRDRQTTLGPVFRRHIDEMKLVHEGFLRSSDGAAKRLIQIQEDPAVKLWLTECNEVAQDLTAAWNLDSLLIKPMQRITKYPNLISQLLQYTPADHPDRPGLMEVRTLLETAILEINKTKKNFELVGQIVGRKRKDSDVRAGFARAFGKRVDKLQVSSNRPPEDPEYTKLHEKFGDDYLRLQVVLRDVEFYTRQVSTYVHEFLQLLSAMELVMRLQPSPYPEIESKWSHFNMSMRDLEKVALEAHLTQVRKHVIEPFELVIKCYGNPSLAMKKRAKRRLDYERAVQLKKGGKKIDKQLAELVEQYEALNETLKKELPILSTNTEKIGNICLGNFVNIQVRWFAIWRDKVKIVLDEKQGVPEVVDIMSTFARDFRDMEDHVKKSLAILAKAGNDTPGSFSPSPSISGSTGMMRSRSGRPSELTHLSTRVRGASVNSDNAPTLPTPDFGGRSSGQFAFSPTTSVGAALAGAAAASITASAGLPSPHQYYRDYYSGALPSSNHIRGASSPITPGLPAESSSRSIGSASGNGATNYGPSASASASASGRPSTGRSYDSAPNATRPSVDSSYSASSYMPLPSAGQSSMAAALHASRRESGSTYNSNNQNASAGAAGDSSSINGNRRYSGSGLFHSALPVSEDNNPVSTASANSQSHNGGGYLTADDASYRPRAPSRERSGTTSSTTSSNPGGDHGSGYNVLWLAASLFEFNIETKHEAGYPYLTYQAGEIFDVIAEKGELWLAKNQDDPIDIVGWIWSKHFAKLADS